MSWLALVGAFTLIEVFLPKRALALTGCWRPLRFPLLGVGMLAAAGSVVLIFEVVYLRTGLTLGLLTIPLTLPVALTLIFYPIRDWLFEGGEGGGGPEEDDPYPEPPWWPDFERQLSCYSLHQGEELHTEFPRALIWPTDSSAA